MSPGSVRSTCGAVHVSVMTATLALASLIRPRWRHNVVMRGTSHHPRVHGSRPLLEQRVQFARGHWQREEQAGAVRSAGWWEAVTVTWSPAAAPGRRPGLWHRALATAVDTATPVVAEFVVTSARRLLERQRGTRMALPSSRRQLPMAARALPGPDRPR
jgi:hypothetical protein